MNAYYHRTACTVVSRPSPDTVHGVYCAQTYGPGALKGTLAWLRHVAQVIGKGDLAAEPLTETEEAQIYQQVSI